MKSSPLKSSRSHEVQPVYHGFSLLHARWFKQLRRIQNYCRWVENAVQSPEAMNVLHGISLWHSILQAPGFVPNFCAWWPMREFKHPEDPMFVPACRPDIKTAYRLFDTFLAEVRMLETRLQTAKAAHRRHRHEVDKNLIFREVAKDKASPVEVLLQREHAQVESVDEQESAVVLDRPVNLNATEPVWIAGSTVSVIHAESDKVWLDDVSNLQPKDPLVQTTQVGSLDAIFDAFQEQWRARWCRHDAVPNSQWEDIICFSKRVLRPCRIPPLQLDAQKLFAELARKKSTAATGLDGVSRGDMQALGQHAMQSYMNMYHRAETDGIWPAQITAGKVHSLAKVADASLPDQFRPITIFSLAYRLWSSLQARYLLSFAECWVHSGVYGSRQKLHAAHLWSKLNQEIEHAYATGQPLAGLSADLSKCFNTIPRWPTLVIAILAGTPDRVTTAWAGALQSMVRHFKVRDSFSAGFPTSTGLAEGCGLSVFGMLILDHVFHVWVQTQAPAIRSVSFVDDWQLLTRDPSWACRQLDTVLAFAKMVDLTVDKAKTFAWATDAPTRAALRCTGLRVEHHARQLGGHMGVSRQYTNATLKARMSALEDFWTKLRGSRCSFAGKAHAIRMVAWPRGLHAVSSAPVGDSVWTELRRRVKASLQLDKAGVNCHLLCLTEHGLDPQFCALLQTIKDVRTFQSLDFWAAVVYPCAVGHLDLPPNSPAQVVLTRIQQLGLTVTPQGFLCDHIGSFCRVTVPFGELLVRLQSAWVRVVAAEVSHRSDFGGFSCVDVLSTRQGLASLDVAERALYRLCLAGGFVTADVKAKWNEGPDTCKWCSQKDSLRHRIWECPKFAYLRATLAPDAVQCLPLLPNALALRGWAMLSPTWTSWMQILQAIPQDIPGAAMDFSQHRWNDVFTDGSCLWQSRPQYRVAAWSAVLAHPCTAGWRGTSLGVLGSSVLPGLCQTAFRAELYAVACVLCWASRCHAKVRLWLDCLGVVNKLVLMKMGMWVVTPNQTHADLWFWIAESLAELGTDNLQIMKVPAHRSYASATSRLDWWMIYHNDAADRAAKLANQSRPEKFWSFWRQHVQGVIAAERLSTQVRQLHVAIAKQQVMGQHQPRAETTVVAPKETRQFAPTFDNTGWKGCRLPQLAFVYGEGHAQRAISWWSQRTRDDMASKVCWMSLTQLFIDYNLTFGQPGPLKVNKQWIDVANRPYVAHDQINLRVKLRWFRRFLQNMLKEGQVHVCFDQCRPESSAIQAHVQCVSVQWSDWHRDRVDSWLLSHLKTKCTRNAAALLSLPVIGHDPGMKVDVSLR